MSSDKEYMRVYMLERYKKRRNHAIESLGGRCVECGATEKLELDHGNPKTKDFTIAKGSSFSEKRWKQELAKCQLLCGPCHRFKSIIERGMKPARGSHGTVSSYKYCKCDLCKAAARDYQRRYRALKSMAD
jgi:5-methylcytosine-specific restriction endonuclease McrA